MAKARKDNKGRALRKGECQRKSDKSYVYTYTDPFGKRCYLYASDLKTLREKEAKLLKDQLDGLNLYTAKTATLNVVFDRYIANKQNLKRSSLENYKYYYNLRIRNGLGKRKIADIKYSDIKYLYQYLLNDCQLSISSVNGIHAILSPTFELAVRDDIIRKNPSKGVMAEMKDKKGQTKNPRHALTLAQQRAFMGIVSDNPIYQPWLPLFTVMFGTGCRIGGLIGLRWEDLDFDERFISINHAVSYLYKEEKAAYHIEVPKTDAGIRIIPMCDEIYEVLQKEYEHQKKKGFCTLEIDGMTGFIFYSKKWGVISPHRVNNAIRRIVKFHNSIESELAKKESREPLIIPNFTCHCIRHTFCTRLCENGVNIKFIQEVMGHSNIQTTMDIYTKIRKEKSKKFLKL